MSKIVIPMTGHSTYYKKNRKNEDELIKKSKSEIQVTDSDCP